MSKILLEEPVISLKGFENNPDRVDLKGITKRAVDREKEQKRLAQVAQDVEKYKPLLDKVKVALDTDVEEALNLLFDKFVPSSGMADTLGGELIRAITRAIYRDYNDGDMFFTGYGLETVAPSMQFLSDNGFGEQIGYVMEDQYHYIDNEDDYTKFLMNLGKDVVKKILSNPELLVTPNSVDSRDYDAEDIIDNQYRDMVTISIPHEIETMIDNEIVAEDDVISYLEDELLEWDSAFDGYEIPYGVEGAFIEIHHLTKDGMDLALHSTDEFDFWDGFIDKHQDELEAIENGETEEEDDLDESKKPSTKSKTITEDVSEDKPAPLGPQMGQDSGIATLLNSLIRDEWEAIQGYNDMQNMVRAEQPDYADEFLRVIADINAEENVHVGQLQKLMEMIAPNASEFNSGVEEATKEIGEAKKDEGGEE